MRTWILLTGIALVTAGVVAAQPPSVDIYLCTFEEVDGTIQLGTPLNATAREGYDNQPCFSPDGSYFLYASLDSSGHTDVFRYVIDTGEVVRVTDTPEDEYSPTFVPGGDGFSSVRVETDGATQRLWRFDLDGSNPRLVLADVDSVGYHAWLDENTLALFIVGQPHALRLVDVREPDEQGIALDIGRAVLPYRDTSDALFVARHEESWWFHRLKRPSLEVERLYELLAGSQDTAWTPSGRLLMGVSAAIYVQDSASGTGWWRVAAFREVEGITRIAVSPTGDRLAFVARDR